jgi:hypothetical protein
MWSGKTSLLCGYRSADWLASPMPSRKTGTTRRLRLCLHFAWYNFLRVHRTLRMTPTTGPGVTDHIWSIRELLEAA